MCKVFFVFAKLIGVLLKLLYSGIEMAALPFHPPVSRAVFVHQTGLC